MKKFPVLFCLLLCGISVLAQERFSSVEERMTGKEFKASGLDKLSDEELAALNSWLRDHSVATLENVATVKNTAAPSSSSVGAAAGPSWPSSRTTPTAWGS